MPRNNVLRIFGYLWSALFGFIGFVNDLNLVFLALALCFFVSATFFPRVFFTIHIFQAWVKIGNFIGHINSKIIVFILFFFIFTPIGIYLRIAGKDLLKKKIDKNRESYFEKRHAQPGTMTNQY